MTLYIALRIVAALSIMAGMVVPIALQAGARRRPKIDPSRFAQQTLGANGRDKEPHDPSAKSLPGSLAA